ncbi:MAG TPA: GGDEF domain-containing protein, partial [Terriglobia bacterium]|nr:GGDEF domain-containing protein [Terriglobia bacterium]
MPLSTKESECHRRMDWCGAMCLAALLLLAAAVLNWVAAAGRFQNPLSDQPAWLPLSVLGCGLVSAYQYFLIVRFRRRLAEQAALEAELRQWALCDPLTGLYNRRVAQRRLAEELSRSQRQNSPVILLSLDLNNLKAINDRYGHAVGDLVLQEFARRIQQSVRQSDVAARVGGDEFLILFPNGDPEQVRLVRERLAPLQVSAGAVRIPVSFAS